MGWARGAEVAEDVWNFLKKYIPQEKRKSVANKLIDIFEKYDCDAIHSDAENLAKDSERYNYDEDDD